MIKRNLRVEAIKVEDILLFWETDQKNYFAF